MTKDIYYEYCVAMSYKTWPFKEILDLFILRVFESGIQHVWESDVRRFKEFIEIDFSFCFIEFISISV